MSKLKTFANGAGSETVVADSIQEAISKLVKENPVVLFMKGTPEAPYCGFSAKTSGILQSYGVPLTAIDVLSAEGFRDGIKAFTNWPTIPQVFIKGEFVGGCDIVVEMDASGELKELLKDI